MVPMQCIGTRKIAIPFGEFLRHLYFKTSATGVYSSSKASATA